MKNQFKVIIFLLVLTIGILFRVIGLGGSIWHDEEWATGIRLGTIEQVVENNREDSHPPLYSMFMFLWDKTFGDSEVSVRIPSFIFGVISIFLLYFLGLKFADPNTALLAAILFCLSPAQIWYSHEARAYAGITFLLLALALSYQKIRETDSPPRSSYLAYTVFLLALASTHYYGVIYLGVITAGLFLGKDSFRKKRVIFLINIFVIVCIGAFLFSRVYGIAAQKAGELILERGHLRKFTFFEFWMLFFNWFLFGNSLWEVFPYSVTWGKVLGNLKMVICQSIGLFLLLRGIMFYLKDKDKPGNRYILVWLFSLPVVLLLLPFVGFKNFYIERSLLLISPFFYLVLAKGALSFKEKFSKTVCSFLLIAFAVFSLTGFVLRGESWTVYKQKPDWRSAAKYIIQERAHSRQEQIFIFSKMPTGVLSYYFQKEGIDLEKVEMRRVNTTKKIIQILPREKNQVFYLIKNRYWFGNFNALLRKVLSNNRFKLLDKKTMKGLGIFKFQSKI